MTAKTQCFLFVVSALVIGVSGPSCNKDKSKTQAPAPRAVEDVAATPCNANESWITAPLPPTEIGDGVPIGEETNCQFQQFAWQWFLSLVSPSATTPTDRVFETYPVWLGSSVKNQCAAGAPIGKKAFEAALFVRDLKTDDQDSGTFLPVEMDQATGGVLFDQAGNVVLYNVRYSPNECEATSAGFLPNTIEIKTSWRVLSPKDPQLATYYTIQANIEGFQNNPQTLGLVGFHLVINTKNHPEFVWASFEHASNVPDCNGTLAPPKGGWSFTSAAAAACLTQNGIAGCSQFNFNQEVNGAPVDAGVTGAPDEVCRVFADGTDPEYMTGDNNNDTNRDNIDMLNTQLVGPSGFLTRLSDSNPMAVWKNYFMVGSLWTLNGTASNPATNQRGSLELSNTTMETNFQDPGNNCFTCHNFNPKKPHDVSHIYKTLTP